jgi:hypothetical protein
MHQLYGLLHGGGGGGDGLADGAVVRVLRLQVLTQRGVHSAETLTLHVVKKKFRVFRIGAVSMTALHVFLLKPSQRGMQVTRHSSCGSAIAAGGPMESRTSATQAATMAILSMAAAMHGILLQLARWL